MKKILVLATAAFLFTGAFAHDGDGKKCGKGKDATCTKSCCSKKEADKKETKTATKTAVKKA